MVLIECMDLVEVNAGDVVIRQVQTQLYTQVIHCYGLAGLMSFCE